MSRYKPIYDFNDLQRGMLIRHRADQRVFVVTASYGNRATAVASVDMTNVSEWEVFERSEAVDRTNE